MIHSQEQQPDWGQWEPPSASPSQGCRCGSHETSKSSWWTKGGGQHTTEWVKHLCAGNVNHISLSAGSIPAGTSPSCHTAFQGALLCPARSIIEGTKDL